jgi:hypothetical protein
VLPNLIAADEHLVSSIRERLRRDDAFLIGLDDDRDGTAAASAQITASSEQPGGEAANVVSGQTRCVHGVHGVSPERTSEGLHRWMSAANELPASIRFDWQTPQTIRRIQLVFDTGMHRHLTLSHHDGYTSRMTWGSPQPETIRDYAVQILEGDDWQTVFDITGNYQRLRRHSLAEGKVTCSLRILVTGTNGIDHARMMAVRIE